MQEETAMFSIEEARRAHVHATYHIPTEGRRECGTENIIREIEAAVAREREARRHMLRKALIDLCRRIRGRHSEAVRKQQADSDVALGTGN
jgi:hypothetical protein